MSRRPAAVNVPIGPSNETRVTVASMQADGGVGRSCFSGGAVRVEGLHADRLRCRACGIEEQQERALRLALIPMRPSAIECCKHVRLSRKSVRKA